LWLSSFLPFLLDNSQERNETYLFAIFSIYFFDIANNSFLFCREYHRITIVPMTSFASIRPSSSDGGDEGATQQDDDDHDHDDSTLVTILGFGSLLSERSSRMTFPDLQNFRMGRVPNYRRIFRQPTSLFFRHGIANLATKEMSSLSAEYCKDHPGFICSVFEVPNKDMMEDGVPSAAFLEREEEYNIIEVEYVVDVIEQSSTTTTTTTTTNAKKGVLCTASTDEVYLQRWGADHFQKRYGQYGVTTIWGWEADSGLRPCPVYLRHCYFAAKSLGDVCFDSFLDETFLVDRKTTIREYVQRHPGVLDATPPPELMERYSG
jgi:hypothetical protein